MKRLVTVFLTLCLFCSMLAVHASAADVPFTVSADGKALTEYSVSTLASFTQDSWVTYESVTVYTFTVPVGTREVALSDFEAGNVLVYNYSTDGNYIAGVYDDSQAGAPDAVRNLDGDHNGVSDYLAVQKPYDANWSTELLYLVSFQMADFSDVNTSDWYYEDVQKAAMMGVMDGTAGTVFSPKASVTRAMLVTMLYRLAGEPEATEKASFTDIASGSWYEAAVCWANAKGLVDGRSDTVFDPNASITREEAAAILWRYAGKAESTQSLAAFTDSSTLHAWGQTAMQWAVEKGLVNGRTDTTLVPGGTILRVEAAALLVRLAGIC